MNEQESVENRMMGYRTQIEEYQKDRQELAEMLGCADDHATIKAEIKMLIKEEDRRNGVVDLSLSKFVRTLVRKKFYVKGVSK